MDCISPHVPSNSFMLHVWCRFNSWSDLVWFRTENSSRSMLWIRNFEAQKLGSRTVGFIFSSVLSFSVSSGNNTGKLNIDMKTWSSELCRWVVSVRCLNSCLEISSLTDWNSWYSNQKCQQQYGNLRDKNPFATRIYFIPKLSAINWNEFRLPWHLHKSV